MTLQIILSCICGFFWTVVYIDSIRIGIKDRSYAMPLWALGLNISWELLYFVNGLGLDVQTIINGTWFLFDIGLVYTYFRYGRKYITQDIHARWFYLWGVLVLIVSFLLQYIFFLEFHIPTSAIYTAFLQNLLMSILFINMLVKRGSSEGQTMIIAVSKCIGSLASSILFGMVGFFFVIEPSTFVFVLGILILFFDLLYIVMLVKVKKNEKRIRVQH